MISSFRFYRQTSSLKICLLGVTVRGRACLCSRHPGDGRNDNLLGLRLKKTSVRSICKHTATFRFLHTACVFLCLVRLGGERNASLLNFERMKIFVHNTHNNNLP